MFHLPWTAIVLLDTNPDIRHSVPRLLHYSLPCSRHHQRLVIQLLYPLRPAVLRFIATLAVESDFTSWQDASKVLAALHRIAERTACNGP